MITLHHAPQSRSSRIIWLLEELGVPYTVKITTVARMDGSGGADPGNPHPDKKVPALEDDGELITESIAVCLYLTDKYPAAGIGPQVGEPLRGKYLTWLAYYAGVVEPVINTQLAGLGDHPAFVRAWAGREALDRRVLEALNAGPFMLGEKFSAIDILFASMGHWSRTMLPPGDVLDAYLARLNSRPALGRAMARDNG